jgi:hypothetical protein
MPDTKEEVEPTQDEIVAAMDAAVLDQLENPPPENNAGGFVQVEGHGKSDEELEAIGAAHTPEEVEEVEDKELTAEEKAAADQEEVVRKMAQVAAGNPGSQAPIMQTGVLASSGVVEEPAPEPEPEPEPEPAPEPEMKKAPARRQSTK